MADVRVSLISKEGFLYKKGGIIKSWSRRYFVLNPQSLCYFRSESHEMLEPLGRIFLSDIVSISTESTEKKKAFVFVLHTKKRAVLLQGANNEDRDKWVASIKKASELDEEAENKDPFRKSLRRLTPGVKRVTLFKDPARGIGCTIKNQLGHIYVNRIIENGPISETGILRPGDEILDIHGVSVANKSVAEVVEIIKQCPSQFLATVRPITSVHKQRHGIGGNSRVDYASIVHPKQPLPLPARVNHRGTRNGLKNGEKQHSFDSDITSSSDESLEYATVKKHVGRRIESPIDDSSSPPRSTTPSTSPSYESQASLEDVGNYDDEEDGDVPPPLPAWTEDALILVDPPPVPARVESKFNIYNTNPHLLPGATGSGSSPSTPQHSPFSQRKKKLSSDELLSYNHGHSPCFSRRSPPNFPPPRPGQLMKSYSQDALDQIDVKPPVPPRLKRCQRPHQGSQHGSSSPKSSPRDSPIPRESPNLRDSPNPSPGNSPALRARNRHVNDHHQDTTYNSRTPCHPKRNHQYEDVDFGKHKPAGRINYADLSFVQECVTIGNGR